MALNSDDEVSVIKACKVPEAKVERILEDERIGRVLKENITRSTLSLLPPIPTFENFLPLEASSIRETRWKVEKHLHFEEWRKKRVTCERIAEDVMIVFWVKRKCPPIVLEQMAPIPSFENFMPRDRRMSNDQRETLWKQQKPGKIRAWNALRRQNQIDYLNRCNTKIRKRVAEGPEMTQKNKRKKKEELLDVLILEEEEGEEGEEGEEEEELEGEEEEEEDLEGDGEGEEAPQYA